MIESLPSEDQEMEKMAQHAAEFSQQFFERLCAAARKDGRTLDPLWGDLADDEADNDENHHGRYDPPEGNTRSKITAPSKRTQAYHTTQLILSQNEDLDLKLYNNFRSELDAFVVHCIENETSLSDDPAWSQLQKEAESCLNECYSNTFLRQDFLDMFWMTKTGAAEGLLVVPKYQFIYIELCRVREGLYGKSFRRILEVFDIKTQMDRLESVMLDASQEKIALNCLAALRTQWPNPSNSALKQTKVVSLLQHATKVGSTETIRDRSWGLLNYWKQLNDLGKITEVLQSGGKQGQRLKPALVKASKALLESARLEDATMTFQNQQQMDCSQSQNDDQALLSATPETTMQMLTISLNSDAKKAANAFQDYGVVVISEKVGDLEDLNEQAQHALEAAAMNASIPQLVLGNEDTSGSNPIRLRLDKEKQSSLTSLGERIQEEFPSILLAGDETSFRLDEVGVLQTCPRNQPNSEGWHRSGQSLFLKHHDAYEFHVFIPLFDVTNESGSVEVIPRTHHHEQYEEAISIISTHPEKLSDLSLRLNTVAGTVIVVDSRLLRRFKFLESSSDQKYLYFAYTKSWFTKPGRSQHPYGNSPLEDTNLHAQCLLVSRLRQLVLETSSPKMVSPNDSYGHIFFTNRFETILLEGLLSDDEQKQSVATANMAAVVHFCRLTEGDKETMAREFIFSLTESAYYRKSRAFRKVRGKRQKQEENEVNGFDEKALFPGAKEAKALFDLTATIILEETTLLSKLGFTLDSNGIGVAVLLAMLKAHASRAALGCIGISEFELEQAFTSWWLPESGRFVFHGAPSDFREKHVNREILVIFNEFGYGEGGVDWGDSIRKAVNADKIDVLHVIDPAFSCFLQDPGCKWNGYDFYHTELKEILAKYQSVCFVGNCFSASAALRFSNLADVVIAVAPQIDIAASTETIRKDIPSLVQDEFHDMVREDMKKSKATISIHYSKFCRDHVEQVQLLPKRRNIQLVTHNVQDSDLFSHLRATGKLGDIIDTAVSACGRHRKLGLAVEQ